MLEEPAWILFDDLLGLVKVKYFGEFLCKLSRATVSNIRIVGSLRRLGCSIPIEARPRLHFGACFQHPAHDRSRPAFGPRNFDGGDVGCWGGGAVTRQWNTLIRSL
jgi:hypothetical protein